MCFASECQRENCQEPGLGRATVLLTVASYGEPPPMHAHRLDSKRTGTSSNS